MQDLLKAINSQPLVVAAIISAIISLVIAGVTGLFVVWQSTRKLDNLRNELLEKAKVDRFIASSARYHEQYKLFLIRAGNLNREYQTLKEEADGTAIVQCVLDFFHETRLFYNENKLLIGNPEIDRQIETAEQI